MTGSAAGLMVGLVASSSNVLGEVIKFIFKKVMRKNAALLKIK